MSSEKLNYYLATNARLRLPLIVNVEEKIEGRIDSFGQGLSVNAPPSGTGVGNRPSHCTYKR